MKCLILESLNPRYFQLKYGRYIIRRYRPKPSEKSLKTGCDVTFPEFIHWILDPAVDEDFKFNPHWARYEDLCQPCVVKYDYIVNFDTFDADTKFSKGFLKAMT